MPFRVPGRADAGTVPVAVLVDERASVVYVDRAGNILSLTDIANGTFMMPGAQGLGMPPYNITAVDAPAIDGQLVRGVSMAPRPIFLPMYIEASTRQEVEDKIRRLAYLLDPRRGPGELRVYEANGLPGRRIKCFYAGGMEGDESDEVAGLHWQTFGLKFTAYEPAWLGLNDSYLTWDYDPGVSFLPITLPLVVAPSDVFGTVDMVNVGDEIAYPRWKVTGPATSFTLANNDLDQAFTVTRVMADSTKFVAIDCTPGVNTVVDETGANQWPALSSAPPLWSLLPGDNNLDLNVAGAGVGSKVELWLTPRYKTT